MPRRLAPALVLIVALAAAPDGAARITGPCEATIAGQDVSTRDTGAFSDPITIDQDALVSVMMSASQPIDRLKVEIEFAGVRWVVHDRPATGTSWASEAPLADWAEYGMGLYKVVGSSSGSGFTCEGAALVSVEGDDELDPLVTVAGAIGLTLAIAGAFAILAIAARVGISGGAQVFLGAFFGLMLGAGVGVLLQQFSVVYPTLAIAVGLLALGAGVGVALSLVGLPTRASDAR